VIGPDRLRVAILIVGFRNAQDVKACLTALSCATAEPRFDVFVCENGGLESFDQLCDALTGPGGPCASRSDDLSNARVSADRFVAITCLALRGRPSRVWIGCAKQNLGYAGGVNAWLAGLLKMPDWDGVWILNPDSEPEPDALRALVDRAVTAGKGMVGSTIVPSVGGSHIHCRAGHRWRKLRTNLALIGLGEPVDEAVDPEAVEADLDCIAGGSMYVTRACLEKIGLMDERFFLFYEDADWSFRAKKHGLGYAPDSIVPHKGGTTIGSARLRAERSRLSVYLESRNHLHFVRMHCGRYFPIAMLLGCAEAASYLLAFSPRNFKAAIEGLVAGMRGETGRPNFHQ
jgi:GT2 family glycosyltransferase